MKIEHLGHGGKLSFGAVAVVLALLILPAVALERLFASWLWVSAYLVGINGLTAAFYWWDKWKAREGAWRVSESNLHLLELLGGWPAAFLWQRLLRHKIAKWSYQMIFWIIVTGYQLTAFEVLNGGRIIQAIWFRLVESIQQYSAGPVTFRRTMKNTVYIILFRGVGGKTQLPTKELREKLSEAGFESVATYINSGNAVVRSRQSRKEVIATIAALCRKEFGFDKAIFAPTLEEWERVAAQNPFARQAGEAPTTVHAALLAGVPKAENLERVRACAVGNEDLQIVGHVAYLHTPHGFGKSKMAAKFDAWIGVVNSARNWNSVLKLAELGREAEGRT